MTAPFLLVSLYHLGGIHTLTVEWLAISCFHASVNAKAVQVSELGRRLFCWGNY